MKATFTIPGRLPGLNEIINAGRTCWQAGYGQKKKAERLVSMAIIMGRVPKFIRPVRCSFRWYEKDRRRDGDNIRSGEKFIMDALTKRLRIVDDNQKWVRPPLHEILVDKKNPRVEVTIEEAGEAA